MSSPAIRFLSITAFALVVVWTPRSTRGSTDDLAALDALIQSEKMRAAAPSRQTGEFGLATLPKRRPLLKPDPPGTRRSGITMVFKGRTVLVPYPPRDIPSDFPDYVGTKIAPDPKAGKNVAEFQRLFAENFNRFDPCPQSRTAHFDWLPHYEGLRHVGWWGDVIASESQPNGAWLVRIQIRPQLHATRMKTHIADYVEETYLVQDGQFALVGSDAAVAKDSLQYFPLP